MLAPALADGDGDLWEIAVDGSEQRLVAVDHVDAGEGLR